MTLEQEQTALAVANAASEWEGCLHFWGIYFTHQICGNPGQL